MVGPELAPSLPGADWSLAGLESFRTRAAPAATGVHELVASIKADPHIVMHVAAEYSVPHLGLHSQLMFGGLGKVR